ncbi:hypothetical protein [Balneola sp. MJW-20]|uniref:hypothetical protein n=1 Tax=Gracilimonas aurantiaca TaxID=3234185 RepID=UPI00390CAE74
MELLPLVIGIIISGLVALLGKDRKIGYGWSFMLCLFLTPIIGLIIILFSKKEEEVEFVDIKKDN